MRDEKSINVLLKSGQARRLPRNRAERLFEQGLAKHYISNTVFRAMKLGIEVKNPNTRDMDGSLRKQIQAAKAKIEKKAKKKRGTEVEVVESLDDSEG